MITRGAFVALVKAHRGRVGKLPRQAEPTRIVAKYQRRLAVMMADLRALVLEQFDEATLKRLAGSASRVAADAEDDDTDAIVDEIAERFAEKWSRARMKKIVQPIAGDVEKFNAAQLNRQLVKIVGVDVVGGEPWLQRAASEFTTENVALIKSIPDKMLSDLETKLTREIADGVRWEDLVETVQDTLDVGENRAKLIARDQTGKFYGDLNRVRQTDLGIERFTWRTVNDERVRPEHAEREGESYAWAEPPDGETPGEPVLCRCNAEPDLSALLEEDDG